MGFFKKDTDKACRFTDPKDVKINEALTLAFNAMQEKGYDPYSQLMYYLYTEDEIHITSYNGARQALMAIDRDDLMKHILRTYFEG
ncbi:MAG: IreB family regulatory phosphoprotein [Ruminococcus sp.]|nr:IreB family regulatory phosphoprotein [Ruminococcus sp.]